MVSRVLFCLYQWRSWGLLKNSLGGLDNILNKGRRPLSFKANLRRLCDQSFDVFTTFLWHLCVGWVAILRGTFFEPRYFNSKRCLSYCIPIRHTFTSCQCTICIPILKTSLDNRTKIYDAAFSVFLCLTCRHSQFKPVSKLILYNTIGGTIMIINALFDFFFTGMSIMTMSCSKDLVIDGCPYFGQINTFTMKAWLNLTQYPSSKSYCN